MTRFSATVVLPVSAHVVAEALADLDSVGQWNPAIKLLRSFGRPAVVGDDRQGLIRGVVPCRLAVLGSDGSQFRYRLRALGSVEEGSWQWHEAGGQTSVTHSFRHFGAIASLAVGAFAPVAAWRLERLAAVVA
jgi:hypothetical protein